MSKTETVCGIAGVHHAELGEYFSLPSLDLTISYCLLSENQDVSLLMRKRPSWSVLCKVKYCLVAIVESSPVSRRTAPFSKTAGIYLPPRGMNG